MSEANKSIGHQTSKNPVLTAFSTLDEGRVHGDAGEKPAISELPGGAGGPEIPPEEPFREPHSQNRSVDLARIGWVVTVGACLIAALVLVIQGYVGYAAVTFAVAVSAAVNLT